MSTRGAYGFRFHDLDKVTYNHSDSYPTGLGVDVAKFIRKYSDGEMQKMANQIQLVDENSQPTPGQIEKYSYLSDESVSTHKLTEWYVLLRSAQGDFDALAKLDVMIDSHLFLLDSLWCEWAYIINLDNSTLEIYKGFNRDADAPGRYSAGDRTDEYKGVRLVETFSFDYLRHPENGPEDLMKELEDKYYKEG